MCDCVNIRLRLGDTRMNKKAYESPEMIKRIVSTGNIAASTSDDNEFSGDIDWE